jgi:hypothetical protein
VASDPTNEEGLMGLNVNARLKYKFTDLEQDDADQVLAALKQAPDWMCL